MHPTAGASVLLLAAFLTLSACNSAAPTTGATASASGTAASSARPTPSEAAPSAIVSTPAPKPPPPAAQKYLPATCSFRMFVDGTGLFGGGIGSRLGGLEEALVAYATARAGKSKERTKELAGHGGTLDAVRTAAACEGKKHGATTSIAFDKSKLDAPLSAIAASAFGEAKKPLAPKTEGAVALLDAGKLRIATIDDEGILLLAESDEDRKAALEGHGAEAFDAAKGSLIWFEIPATPKVPASEGKLTVTGDIATIDALFAPPLRMAAQLKANPEATIKKLESFRERAKKEFSTGRFAKFNAMLPAFENAKVTADGGRIHVTTSAPAASIPETLEAIASDPVKFFGR